MPYALDPTHSSIGFAVRHMMISKVRGTFGEYSVDANLDAADLTKSMVSASIQIGSINTGDAGRDTHLKSADFFDADKFPTLDFKSSAIKKAGDDYTLEGTLKAKGTEKPVTFTVEVSGPAKDPWGNTRLGFTLKGKLNREDFGLTWNKALESGGVVVGKDVTIELQVELLKKS